MKDLKEEIGVEETQSSNLDDLHLSSEGEGHNASLLTVAAGAYKRGASPDDTLKHLQAEYASHRADYKTAPQRAVDRVWEAKGDLNKLVDVNKPKTSVFDDALLSSYERTTDEELVKLSPAKLDAEWPDIVQAVSSEKELICAETKGTKKQMIFTVGTIKEEIEKSKFEIDDFKFLNPATFKKKKGVELPGNGYLSKRCNANVKARRWMVLEGDFKLPDGSVDVERRERFTTFVMTKVASFAPLVFVVETGGKSLHFWFDTFKGWNSLTDKFFDAACKHGADSKLRVKSQTARMPNVSSEKEGRREQKLVYYDPKGVLMAPNWNWEGFNGAVYNTNELAKAGAWHYCNGIFLRRDSHADWMVETPTATKLTLRGVVPGGDLQGFEIENLMRDVKNTQSVSSYGSLAGHRKGLVEMQGQKFLVTNEAKFLTPVKGDFPLVKQIFQGCFKEWESHFMSWLYVATKGIYESGGTAAIPAAAFCGEPESYKSFLQEHILTPLFGSRSTDPSLAMKGGTSFNADVAKAEHLFFGDLDSDGNRGLRDKIGAFIKQRVANDTQTCHPKGLDATSVRICQALTISTNLEDHNLAVLPPLDNTIEGKLFIYYMHQRESPVADTSTFEKRKAFSDAVGAELPMLLHYLLNEFQIPKEYRDNRFMVKKHIASEIDELLIHLTDSPEVMPHVWKEVESDDDFQRFGKAVFTASELSAMLEIFNPKLKNIYKSPTGLTKILKDAERMPKSGIKFLRNVNRTKNGKKEKARWWEFTAKPSDPIGCGDYFDEETEKLF